MSKSVFVTGGAGYVGSHCCKAFAEAGWDVTVYDNLSRGWSDFVKWGRLIEGDLLDTEALDRALADVQPDAVAHFAGFAYVGESIANPSLYFQNNTAASANLLWAVQKADVETFLFSSTCATYGVPSEIPIREGHPQAPINPYGWSKLLVERMLTDFDREYGIRSVPLRYFNAAGADPTSVIGERHEPETHLIPLAIRSAMEGEYVLTIFGNDFDTPDGTCIRDYIHVNDLAQAHLKALDYLCNGGASDVFNLGTGTGISVLELVDAIERVSGNAVRWKIGARRAGDPPVLVAAANKAANTLDWRPKRSSVDQLLIDAWRWHEKEHYAQRARREFFENN